MQFQCNICIRALPAGYNNYERPFFCTKQELQLHFRGKHTKQYLEMVAAKTGRPAGKVVQLGRHNSAKPDLNIWVNKKAAKIGPDAEALIKDPLPTISVNSPDSSNLATCNFRQQTFQGKKRSEESNQLKMAERGEAACVKRSFASKYLEL